MRQFIIEATYIFAALFLFGLSGLGAVLVLVRQSRFVLLASPLAGILLVNLVSLGVYSTLHLALGPAAAIGGSVCLFSSGSYVIISSPRIAKRDLIFSGFCLISISIAYAFLSCDASIMNGDVSLLFTEGTDQFGYANVADWMRDHAPTAFPFKDAPAVSENLPYQSFPNIMLGYEPRMGAFAFLGIVGWLRSVPSTFAYDSASAVFLAAGVLGVTAVFAKNYFTCLILVLGLMASDWLDFTHAGFLGKALAYPSLLFLLGIFFQTSESSQDALSTLLLMLLAASIGMLLSGTVAAGLIIIFCGGSVLIECYHSRRFKVSKGVTVAMMAFGAAFASGGLARPLNSNIPISLDDINLVMHRSLDLRGWTTLTGTNNFGLAVAISLGFVLGSVAILNRMSAPCVMLLGSSLFLPILIAVHAKSELMQLSGFLYPAMLCGGIMLVSNEGNLSHQARVACLVSILVLIGLRLPRAVAATKHSTDRMVVKQTSISLKEIDAVAQTDSIGGPILVDLGTIQLPVLALTELGRRNMQLQFTADSWFHAVGGWRGWPVPKYVEQPKRRLIPVERLQERDVIIFKGNRLAVVGYE